MRTSESKKQALSFSDRQAINAHQAVLLKSMLRGWFLEARGDSETSCSDAGIIRFVPSAAARFSAKFRSGHGLRTGRTSQDQRTLHRRSFHFRFSGAG